MLDAAGNAEQPMGLSARCCSLNAVSIAIKQRLDTLLNHESHPDHVPSIKNQLSLIRVALNKMQEKMRLIPELPSELTAKHQNCVDSLNMCLAELGSVGSAVRIDGSSILFMKVYGGTLVGGLLELGVSILEFRKGLKMKLNLTNDRNQLGGACTIQPPKEDRHGS